MRCRDVQQFTSALVDGELDAQAALDLEKHIATCEPCRTRAESERLVKQQLQRQFGAVTAPEGLRERLHAALERAAVLEQQDRDDVAPDDASRQRPAAATPTAVRATPVPAAPAATWGRWRALVPTALAAGLTLFFLAPQRWISLGEGPSGAGVVNASLGGPLVLSDVAGRHAKNLPPEVPGPNADRVGNWFQGKVDFPVRPPVFREAPGGLVGGRVSWVRDEPAAHLFYDVEGRHVSVIVFARGRRLPVDGIAGLCVPNRKVWMGRANGINVALMERDRVAYAVASELSEPQILRLVSGF